MVIWLLIEPFGIEIAQRGCHIRATSLLIEPFGIEIGCCAAASDVCTELLIEPFGIEICGTRS